MSSVSSATSSNAAYYAAQQKLFSKLDTDENGKLSKDEFVAGRPQDVSEEQASTLYSKIDTTSSNALTEDQLSDGMEDNRSSSSPESQISPEVMAVLMQLQQGGMMSSGGGAGGQGGQFAANVYASMDADSDGSVTEAEFISARPDDVSEDDAKALYASIDTEGAGSITEEQFADSMKSAQGGAAPSGGGQSAEEIYEALDTNQDGVVSQDEFLAGKPDDMSTEDATALFDALDTEDSGSITEEQFAASMQGPRGPGGPPPSGGGQSSEETYDALDTNQDGVVSQDEFLAAKPDDVSTEDATALFKSLDTENAGSISEEQFSDFMEASLPSMNASLGMSGGTTDISSLLALLDTTASEAEDTASVLA